MYVRLFYEKNISTNLYICGMFKCIEQSNNALNTKDITYTPTTVPIYM